MNKHLTKRRVISYLVFLLLACTMVFGVTYARYVTFVSGKASAKTAAVQMNTSLDLTGTLVGLKPGESKQIEFEVRNFEASAGSAGSAVSEVGQEYSVTVTTTGNLPLTYTLSAGAADAGQGKYVVTTGGKDAASSPTTGGKDAASSPTTGGKDAASSPITWTGGSLPYSAGGISHTYTLTVTWPKETADAAYTDEIDLVTLTVDAKQTQPGVAESTGS